MRTATQCARRAFPVVTTTCAAVGCQQTIQRPFLMCVDHWRLVPAVLRRQVLAAARLRRHEPGAEEARRRAAQAAIDAVHGKQLARKDRADASTRPLF